MDAPATFPNYVYMHIVRHGYQSFFVYQESNLQF
jgi:hypothetical protein